MLSLCQLFPFDILKKLNKEMLAIWFDGLKMIAGALGTSSCRLESPAILVSICNVKRL